MTPQEEYDAIPLEKRLAAVKQFYINMANSKSEGEQTSYEKQNNAMAGWIAATLEKLIIEVRALQHKQHKEDQS